VEWIGAEDGVRRSWVWRCVDNEVEYAIDESVVWKMVAVNGWP
jgi:hypothetical protein